MRSPPFALGRVAILMLGSHDYRYLAIVLLAIAVELQTGATSSDKAIKMSARLAVGQNPKQSAAALESRPPKRRSCPIRLGDKHDTAR